MRNLVVLPLALALTFLSGCGKSSDGDTLLNVSYDPTRELWEELNEKFITAHEKDTGRKLTIEQSHGGSGSQARSVIDGQEADVVTLALWNDTDAIRRKGLIDDGWEKRKPNGLPYHSTIVFVVRKGNPKGIKDWKDIVEGDVGVITPNPKTSGNGRLSFLAAWASVSPDGKNDDAAQRFVTEVYRRVKKLDTAARASTITFAQQGIGDVHLTWENEAHLEVLESKGKLEIVYPKSSILAEPFVAVVDKNVEKKGTRALAEKYLEFTYTEEAQEILAKHYYRPSSKEILKKNRDRFPDIKLIPVSDFAGSWGEAHKKFFADKAIFDDILDRIGK